MNFSSKIALLFYLQFCCLIFSSYAQSFQEQYQYSYYEDKIGSATAQSLLEDSVDFKLISGNSISLGFVAHPVWMKLDFLKTHEEKLLVIENAHLDNLELFLFSENKLIQTYSSGDLKPFKNRTLYYNYFNFKIPINTDKILIQTKNKGLLLLPVKILPFDVFFNYYQNYTLIHWFYFGFVILAVCSNLLFFIWLRESIYFYYALCVTAIGFITAVDFGYTFQILWPATPTVNNFNTTFYCVSFFIVLFTERILNIRYNFPRLYYFYLIIYACFFLAVVISFLGYYSITIQIIYYLALLMPVLALYSGVLFLMKTKSDTSKFFLIGWAGYFISMFVYLASLQDLIPYNTFTTNAMQIGSSIEILFLNLAILSKINTLKKEKEQLLSEQNKMLEEKVRERTLELHEKTDEILSQNEELQNQRAELEAQRDTLENQNKIIEENNLLLKGSKESLEKIIERRTEELKYTNQELTEYNNRLEQFAFITAHNLRGPVSTLLGLSQVYNIKDISDPINFTILEKSRETTIKLDEIIKDLVGILDLQKSVVNLSHNISIYSVYKDVLILLSKEVEESKAIINHNFNEDTCISCVPAYLNNIFYNLISNAIKYGKADVAPHITIEYTISNNDITFRFSDNGRGIDLTRQGEKIFRPYKRFHLDKEGKGLGLYIVKTQVEIMRGRISLESEENKGTTITVVLPAKHY
jgi:two-component system, sensor histidine kinase LadS